MIYHTSETEFCQIAIENIADTGAESSIFGIIIAITLITVGLLFVFFTRNKNTRKKLLLGSITMVLASLLLLFPIGNQTAFALQTVKTSPNISYSSGCSLIEISEVNFSAEEIILLPGDETLVLSATIKNRFSQPVIIYGTVSNANRTQITDEFEKTVRFNGAEGPYTINPLEAVSVEVIVSFANTAQNNLQNLDLSIKLQLDAMQIEQ